MDEARVGEWLDRLAYLQRVAGAKVSRWQYDVGAAVVSADQVPAEVAEAIEHLQEWAAGGLDNPQLWERLGQGKDVRSRAYRLSHKTKA